MNEILFTLPDGLDTTVFYGINNANIILLKNLHPSVKIVARGQAIKLIGNPEDVQKIEQHLIQLSEYCVATNTLSEEHIIEIVKGNQPTIVNHKNTILHGVAGKSILARTENQQKLVKEFETNDLLFAIGPAGSGKTYT
ncbi:MAG: phosphate starvation-inducible protein PhoH, partial [Sphingobacteriia bacterium]|nr:phosphate starvation-inducible protein PhoH [Sphingobacteriia bacterium]